VRVIMENLQIEHSRRVSDEGSDPSMLEPPLPRSRSSVIARHVES
jgi:hypothetical protein